MGGGFSKDLIPDQTGKVAIVTGGNTGIGEITARELARKGAHVILACRTKERTDPTVARIIAATGNQNVEFMQLDLASLKSVASFTDAFRARGLPLHLLINNAGIMMCPYKLTEDGLELQFGTNHVGHFLLTTRLLDIVESSAPSRIVQVSSLAHTMPYKEGIRFDKINSEEGYGPIYSYGQSKLCNVLFARELSKRIGAGKEVYVNAIHPGYVDTELQRNLGDAYGSFLSYFFKATTIFAKSPENGALTTLYAATSPDIVEKNYRGTYFEPYGKLGSISEYGRNDELSEKLWSFTEDILREKGFL